MKVNSRHTLKGRDEMATSTMIPTICPICARDFTAEIAANIPPHIAGHLAIYFVKTTFGKTPEEASTDW